MPQNRPTYDELLQQVIDLQQSMDHFGEGYIKFDKSLHYRYVNKSAAALSNSIPEDLIGKSVLNEKEGSLEPELINFFNLALQAGKELHFDHYNGTRNCWFNYKVIPSTDGISVVIHEKKDFEMAQQAIAHSEKTVRSVLNGLPEGIIVADQEKGSFLYANDTFCKMLGYENGELLKLSVPDLHPVEDLPHILETFQLMLRKESRVAHNLRVKRKDGTVFYADIFAVTIKLDDQECICGIFNDISERKEAEEIITQSQKKIQENELILRQAKKIARMGYWQLDLRTNQLSWSDEIFEIFGRNPKEFTATLESFMSFVHPEDRNLVNESYNNHLKKKEDYNIVHRIITENNEIKFVNERCHTDFDENNNPTISIGVVADITDIHKAEEEARENELRYQTLIQSSPVGMVVTDRKENVLLVNDRFEDITGYNKTDLKNSDDWWQKAYPEEKYRKQVQAKWARAIVEAQNEEEGFKGIEVKVYCKNGDWKYLEVGYISLAGLSMMTFVDVTERKEIEDTLREKDYRMDQLSLHSRTISWEVDKEGLYTYVSDVAETVLGYRSDELVGRKYFYEIHPVDGQEEFRKQAMAVFAQKLEFSDLHNQIEDKNGKIIWVTTNGIPILDENGELLGYRGSDTDITARKKAESALIESEAENRRLFETMAQGVVYQDREGAIFKANPAAERLLGLSFEEMIGYKSTDPRWHTIDENGDPFPGELHPAMMALKTGSSVKDVVMGVYNPVKMNYTWILVNAEPEFRRGEQKPFQVFTTFTDITERKHIEQDLLEQTRLRELIMQIAKRYINIPLSDLDQEINASLQTMGAFVKADRSYIFDYDHENGVIHNTYEWCNAGIDPEIQNLQSVSIEHFPQWLERHQQGLPFIVDSVTALSDEGEEGHLKKALEPQNIKSLITIPIKDEEKLLGFVGFDFVNNYQENNENQEKLLVLFSQVLVNVKNRKKADDTLRENRQFLRDIIDNSGSVIYVKDKEGRYLTVNSKWTEITGPSAEDTIGKTDYQLFTKEQADAFRINDKQVIENGDLIVFEEQLIKNGEIRYFLSIKFPLRDKDGSVIGSCGNSTEITELKKAQLALRESEANLKALLSSSLESIWSVDSSYNIIYTNEIFAQEFQAAYGQKLEKGKNILALLPEQIRNIWKERYDNVLKNERIRFTERFAFENRVLVFDIVMNPILLENRVVAVSVFSKDISEQEQAKEALRISEENFRQIAENVSEVFWLRSPDAQKLLYINPAYKTVYGRSIESLQRDPDSFINSIIEEDRGAIIEAMNRYMESEDFDKEFRIMRPDGEIRWLSSRSMPVRNEKGEITGHTGVAMDITDKKTFELELLERNKQLNLVIQNIPGAVFSCYRETQCHMIFISDFIEQISGYTAKEICEGHKICYSDLIHPDDIRKLRKSMESAYALRERYTHTYRLMHKDGTIRWVYEIGEFQHYDGEMEQKRIDGIVFDITKNITAEEEKLTAIFQATDAERTRISLEIHDGLQQTLVASKLNFELLKKEVENLEPKLKERYQTGLKFLEVAIQEGRSIARSLLPKHVSDFGYVMAVENMLENLDRKKIEFKFYHHKIMLNDDKYGLNLYRITQEAISNILKHAHATKVHINLTHEEGRLILTIEDNGAGFKTEEGGQRKERTIGLQSMKSRATAIGANFEIFSNPGKGTLIVIDMPFHLSETDQSKPEVE